jgi:nicotinamidase-related amidase
MQNILVVVDMQNDFIDGALGTKEAQAILPNVERLVKDFNGKIYFTRDTHSENYMQTQEGKNLPVPHCIKNTNGWEIAPSLIPYAKNIIDKPTFGSTDLVNELILENKKEEIESITLVGLCTDICVVGFVESFLKYIKNNNRKTKIHVIDNACYTFNGEGHDAKECHNTSIDSMKKQGASIKRV